MTYKILLKEKVMGKKYYDRHTAGFAAGYAAGMKNKAKKALRDEYKRGYNDGYKNGFANAVEANAKSILIQEMSKINVS